MRKKSPKTTKYQMNEWMNARINNKKINKNKYGKQMSHNVLI